MLTDFDMHACVKLLFGTIATALARNAVTLIDFYHLWHFKFD